MPAIAPTPFFSESRTAAEIKAELLAPFFAAWQAQLGRKAADSLYIDLLTQPVPSPEQQQPHKQLVPEAVHPLLEEQVAGRSFYYNISASAAAAAPLAAPAEETPNGLEQQAPLCLLHAESQAALTEALAAPAPAFAILNPLEAGFGMELLQQLLPLEEATICLLFSAQQLHQGVAKGKAGKPLFELLGAEAFAEVKAYYKKEKAFRKREDYLLPQLENLFQQKGFHTLQFLIGLPDSGATDQVLLFTSKSKAAYKKIKEMLLAYTDYQEDGVPVFGASQHHRQQLLLFSEMSKYSIHHLMQDLQAQSARFNYKSIDKIADEHSLSAPYIPENYQQAFEQLRDQKKVLIINPKTMQPVKKSTTASLVKFVVPAT